MSLTTVIPLTEYLNHLNMSLTTVIPLTEYLNHLNMSLTTVIPLTEYLNHLKCRNGYSATSNNTTSWYTATDGWAVTFDTARRGLGGVACRGVD